MKFLDKIIVCNLSGTGLCKGDCAKCKFLPQAKIVNLNEMQDDPDIQAAMKKACHVEDVCECG